MKLTGISFKNTNYFKHQNTKNSEIKKSFQNQSQTFNTFITTKEYLAFLGGYTTNLSETFARLDKNLYPKDIYENVKATLDSKNPENKTLYDVHFDKYKGVLDCYSLEELTNKYPEFECVNSVYSVFSTPESFIGKYLNNESEIFTSEEDLALQLVKLYWGKGFSLNDLKAYSATEDKPQGTNLDYTMRKLNIPLMEPEYAHVLKLSNKEYNEKLFKEIVQKKKEAQEAREQISQGEPIVIPKHLSKSHKEHISKSLKEYYQNNPTAIYEKTKRQKEFYEQNPESREEMSIAMEYAWNRTQEGISVKKHLSKFMKKFGNITDEELITGEMEKPKQTALKSFWDKNPWAKEKFSTATKKGWKYIENCPELFLDGKTNEHKVTMDLIPIKSQEKIRKWAKSKGYTVKNDEVFGRCVVNFAPKGEKESKEITKIINAAQIITKKFADEFPTEIDLVTTAKHLALIQFKKDLESRSSNLPAEILMDSTTIVIFDHYLDALFKETPIYEKRNDFSKYPIIGTTDTAITNIYNELQFFILEMKRGYKFADYLSNQINKMYDLILSGNTQATEDLFR